MDERQTERLRHGMRKILDLSRQAQETGEPDGRELAKRAIEIGKTALRVEHE